MPPQVGGRQPARENAVRRHRTCLMVSHAASCGHLRRPALIARAEPSHVVPKSNFWEGKRLEIAVNYLITKALNQTFPKMSGVWGTPAECEAKLAGFSISEICDEGVQRLLAFLQSPLHESELRHARNRNGPRQFQASSSAWPRDPVRHRDGQRSRPPRSDCSLSQR